MTSRIITYPDIVESNNYKVLLIDAELHQVHDLALFCLTSFKEYDIYLYDNSLRDLEWLHRVYDLSDLVLMSKNSKVTISPNDVVYFGADTNLANPIAHLQQIDNQGEIKNDI